jgi:Recombination endonuclease VII
MKTCSKCRQEKPLSEFSLTPVGHPRGSCKACRVNVNIGPDAQRRRLKRDYGLTVDQYNELMRAQEGCCKICKSHYSDQHHGTLCVDHNHKTGQVRGLLCGSCNRALGLFGDDPALLTRAAFYLLDQGHYG